MSKRCITFALAIPQSVAWMSGLVTGLQNQLERFDSACDLTEIKHLDNSVAQTLCFYAADVERFIRWGRDCRFCLLLRGF